MTTCPECGYSYESVDVADVSVRLRALGPGFAELLASADHALASRRPEPAVWSCLEYACHVRDVLLIQRDRAVLALVEDKPNVARLYRDERVELCGYDAHPLPEVLDQLGMAAELCATVFERVDPAVWVRQLTYNWPAAAAQDLAWLGRHTVHEGEHHLMDVGKVLAAVQGSRG